MKPKLIQFSLFAIFAILSGIFGAWLFNKFNNQNEQSIIINYSEHSPSTARFSGIDKKLDTDFNKSFIDASRISKKSVVFIKVTSQRRTQRHQDWFRLWDFFGELGPTTNTGSGVIISNDGYIITNNHVIQNAIKIEISLSQQKTSWEAEVIGTDPSTDLALLKINAKDLTAIKFSNSDNIEIGSWVLAVGNPFNLESTVTAGIISARSRHLNILRGQFPIESFLQTDAAINPGNSGGALVDLNGKLIGINTAIVTRTGTYSGYGFAIPSNIVHKVAEDLKNYGIVQRAFIEAEIKDIDHKIASNINTKHSNGVIVDFVIPNGNAEKAGLKENDIIIKINNRWIQNRAFFEEQLAYRRPGDKVKLLVQRGNHLLEKEIELTNQQGTTEKIKRTSYFSENLGAELEAISRLEKQKFNIEHGIRVFNIRSGAFSRMNIPEGFIITQFNQQVYNDPEQLANAINNTRGRIIIEGIRPDGSRAVFSFFTR